MCIVECLLYFLFEHAFAVHVCFIENLTQIVPYFEKLKSSSKIIWMIQGKVYE